MYKGPKCAIFEWDMEMWCRAKATDAQVLKRWGLEVLYPLCPKHYEYVNNL